MLLQKNMEIIDANIALRYLLNDHTDHFKKSKQIIEHANIYIPNEVIAEIVYVLEKVYVVPKISIKNTLLDLFAYPNITLNDSLLIAEALRIYQHNNIDFVDSVLVAYNSIYGHYIHSFDKKINKLSKP